MKKADDYSFAMRELERKGKATFNGEEMWWSLRILETPGAKLKEYIAMVSSNLAAKKLRVMEKAAKEAERESELQTTRAKWGAAKFTKRARDRKMLEQMGLDAASSSAAASSTSAAVSTSDAAASATIMPPAATTTMPLVDSEPLIIAATPDAL